MSFCIDASKYIKAMCEEVPWAMARVRGNQSYPKLQGIVSFYEVEEGMLVLANVMGLPFTPGDCDGKVFGFHIHEGTSCTGTAEKPFANAGAHYNPEDCKHPYHAGDMPPLFGNYGHAFSVFLTNRFMPEDIIGRTVIIHANPDDFTTQPSGNAGEMIACGVIEKL